MKKFFDFIFSMQFAGTLLLVFAAAIGTATFIENDYGTLAAQTGSDCHQPDWQRFQI
jgi:hypothetical protein